MVQIFNRLEREFEFSRSFNSMMIWPEDMDDSSCLERHCSVLRMSLLWQPYSFFNTMGRDSARLTRLTSMMASRVWPSAFLSCSTRWVTCLYVCRFTSTSLKASSFALFACHVRGKKTNFWLIVATYQLHEYVGLGEWVFVRKQVVVLGAVQINGGSVHCMSNNFGENFFFKEEGNHGKLRWACYMVANNTTR